MFSGKSSWIRGEYENSLVRNIDVESRTGLLLKPMIDDRSNNEPFDVHQSVSSGVRSGSRSGSESESESGSGSRVRIIRGKKLKGSITEHIHRITCAEVILIDEAHMFPDLVEGVKALKGIAIKILVAGLDADSDMKPFDNIMRLIPYADKVTKRSAICVHCGKSAPHTFRIDENVDEKSRKTAEARDLGLDFIPVIGSGEMYKPMCLKCYTAAKHGSISFIK